MYDYLIVGTGLYGAVFAQQMAEKGRKCLVIDRRDHVAGNIYSKEMHGIQVHMYGPHIFHTDMENVWEYVNRFATFNHFTYCPVANYKGELYNLPFNMNTFSKMWGIVTPDEARRKIQEQIAEAGISEPHNLEEQAISLVGTDIYEKLIKGYTEKQWGRSCKDLPAFIIKRLPVRFVFDNNYFNHPHQGIPVGGYTLLIERILDGIEIELGVDFLKEREKYSKLAPKIIYTGPIDEYFGYEYGALEYRSLRFETETLNTCNYQGIAGMNYTDSDTPYTRIIEHKHFEFGSGDPDKTIITREYPCEWKQGDEPYYPVNDGRNMNLYKQYQRKAVKEADVLFGGRLGTYQYMDMDKVIAKALEDSRIYNN